MSNIEPTEEQRAAAIRLWSRAGPTGYGMAAAVEDIARLLAEREAKLREECVRIGVEAGRVERDALRARVAELEGRPQFASVSADGFIATGTGPVHVDDVGSVQDALEKRVAELEAFTLLTDTDRDLTMYAADPAALTRAVREADQLHQKVGGGTGHYVNECLLPCLKDEGLAIIVVGKAHYDDAKADAPAFPMDMQHCFTVEKADADAKRRAEEQEARLKRAIDIIVSEELDRDFGEEPTPRILAVRALLTECGYQPPRCSRGAVIGYSGTSREHKLQECIDEMEDLRKLYPRDKSSHNAGRRWLQRAAGASSAVRAADIHDLMDKMAVLMEGVADGWSDGLDNKGAAAFSAVEEAQQVYTRCAERYGTPEVSRSCESSEGEAEDAVCHSCEKPSPTTAFDSAAGRPMCAACRGVEHADTEGGAR